MESVPEPDDSSPMLTWIWGTSGVSQGSQSSSRIGACTCDFLSGCSSCVTLPFTWIKGSVSFPRGFPTRLSHEAFPRAFPTGLSLVPPCCESILGLKVKAVQGKQFSLEWNGHVGDSGKGGTTLEFLSPFLWIAPPLEIPRERQEFFPYPAGKGSLLSSQEAVTGLLWMWAGRSCFLSSGDGYVRELLELQEGCEGPFVSSRG